MQIPYEYGQIRTQRAIHLETRCRGISKFYCEMYVRTPEQEPDNHVSDRVAPQTEGDSDQHQV